MEEHSVSLLHELARIFTTRMEEHSASLLSRHTVPTLTNYTCLTLHFRAKARAQCAYLSPLLYPTRSSNRLKSAFHYKALSFHKLCHAQMLHLYSTTLTYPHGVSFIKHLYLYLYLYYISSTMLNLNYIS